MVQSAASRYRARLAIAIAISVGILVIELIAAFRTNSLALFADAGHVFADVSGMVISMAAIWLANRPTTGERSYGPYRVEILGATANALLLLGVSAFVIWEGIRRLSEPPAIDSAPIIAVALVALVGNLVSAWLLAPGRGESLLVKGAFLEVLGDLLGAGAVLVAGLVIALTGFFGADALAAILIGLLIVPRTLGLLRDSLDVLMEATPKGVDMNEVRRHVLEAPGVEAVHDLHAWTITSGMNVVSAHVVLADNAKPGEILDHLGTCLADDFDVKHSTFQLETREHVVWEARAEQSQL